MKKLKRALLLVVMALLVFSFTACSDEVCTPCKDLNSDHICDRCGEEIKECIPCVDGNSDAVCDRCGESLLDEDAPDVSLELTALPTRVKYYTGDTFDASGMIITATFEDGTSRVVEDYALGFPASLNSGVDTVFVYYGGSVLRIPIEVSEIEVLGVADARRSDYGKTVLVSGYYVGETSNGFLVKDVSDDTLLEVRGNTLQYAVGDNVRFLAKLSKDDSARVAYLEYSAENTELDVSSSDNEIKALFTSVTGVASWDRMTRSFKESSYKIGTYYKIYADRIYVMKNRDGSLTLHLNDSTSDADSVKTDGVHTVNIVCGTKGAKYITDLFGTHDGSLPGKCFTGVIHAVSLGSDDDSFDLTVLDPSWVELGAVNTPQHQAIVEVAHAFYYKGSYIHYDQYGTRRNINPTPESATSSERLHLDCSSFVNAVYYEAFGENVQPYPTTERSPQTGVMTEYAKNFYGINPDVIGYYETADLDTDEKKADFIEMVRGTLEIGDVIVYRRASSGHAIIYVGNGYFLHSTGASYEYSVGDPHEAYDQVDAKGTISKLMLSTYLDDKDHSRYILASNVVTISILRPLERGLETTDKTDARMTIPGISMEKTSSAPHRSAVYAGDTVVYSITLKNHGKTDVSDITITDYIPEGAEYVGGSRGIVVDNGVLVYSASLDAGAEVSVTYAVKITATEQSEIVSRGNVNGVELNEIFNTVSRTMTENDEQTLVALAKEFVAAARMFDDPIEAAKALYSEALGIEFTDSEAALALIESLINMEEKTFNSESADISLLVKGLYGGYDIRLGYRTDNDRTRLVVENNLSVGDIIIGEYGDETVVELYVYLGGGEFLSISSVSGTVSIFTLESSLTKNLLVSLISFDRYVIIRPSQK